MLLSVITMKTTVSLQYTDVHRSKPARINLQHGLIQKGKCSFRVSIGRLDPLCGMAFLLNSTAFVQFVCLRPSFSLGPRLEVLLNGYVERVLCKFHRSS